MRRELFIQKTRTLVGTTGATTGTTGVPRSKCEKAEEDARKMPTGTTGLGSGPPASAGATGERPVPPAVQNLAKQQFCENLAYRYYRRFTGTTGGSRYHRSKPGTTGSSFSRKTQE